MTSYSNEDTERNIEAMLQARDAIQAQALVKPFIDKRVQEITDKMVAHYRGETCTHTILLGCVAEISAMWSLLADLNSVYTRGITADRMEKGRAERTN